VVQKPFLLIKISLWNTSVKDKKKNNQKNTDSEVVTAMNIKITDIILKKPAVSIPDDGGSRDL
jgi:hypothetical protein